MCSNLMKHKLLALFAIISLIGLLPASLSTTSPSISIAFAKSDKCISSQEGASTSTACSTDKDSDFLSGEAKKECRESGAKCSSSQTGFGEFGNFFKPN